MKRDQLPLKPMLHPRNKHRGHYDFKKLIKVNPKLTDYVIEHPYTPGEWTINFSDSLAVKELNRSLLFSHYQLTYWDFPSDQLCPPVPGRADYIHHLYDLLKKWGVLEASLSGVDIGIGANAIYSLIAVKEYGCTMVGTDVSETSLVSAQKIITENQLSNFLSIRLQPDKGAIFKNVILPGETYTFSLCNPPFYRSKKEAELKNAQKNRNLKLKTARNFAGVSHELWCDGGELEFIRKMIDESVLVKNQIKVFSVLVSDKNNLPILKSHCEKNQVKKIAVIEMGQGQKRSRLLVWTF